MRLQSVRPTMCGHLVAQKCLAKGHTVGLISSHRILTPNKVVHQKLIPPLLAYNINGLHLPVSPMDLQYSREALLLTVTLASRHQSTSWIGTWLSSLPLHTLSRCKETLP
eukprot:PhF_6_TR37609/c0_g1_i2/m.55877